MNKSRSFDLLTGLKDRLFVFEPLNPEPLFKNTNVPTTFSQNLGIIVYQRDHT